MRRSTVLTIVMIALLMLIATSRPAQSLLWKPGAQTCPGYCTGLACMEGGAPDNACKAINNGCVGYGCSGGCP